MSILEVIYEDEALWVVNKPTGLPCVPHRLKVEPTAVSLAHSQCSFFSGGFGEKERGLLHRLDTTTSGLLVFTKSKEAFNYYRSLWKTDQIKKIYRALVTDLPLDFKLPLVINRPLVSFRRSSQKMHVLVPEKKMKYRGRLQPAITYLLNSKILIHSSHQKIFDLEIQIQTGVRHQIRCHLSFLKIPILGDTLYGGSPSERIWLHASKLGIPKIKTGDFQWIECPMPQNWPLSK